MTKIVCIADSHTMLNEVKVPDGDVLIIAGDFTYQGYQSEIIQFNKDIGLLPHEHKIVIAGNHDFLFEKQPYFARSLLTSCTYIQDESVIVNDKGIHIGTEKEDGDIKIWGSPWQPRFFNWAFNLDRGSPLKKKWDLIPDDTDVLVTHGPPHGFGDTVRRSVGDSLIGTLTKVEEQVGCEELRKAVLRVRPKYHIYGHIHVGYGTYSNGHTEFINCSVCNYMYNPVNAPIVIEV